MTKIMIVDDERDLRDMVNLMMQKEGFETEIAEDGADFLNKIDNFQPDLVILDVMMPGLTIKETLEKLIEKKNNSKIILLTVVRFSEEEKERIFKMGNGGNIPFSNCLLWPLGLFVASLFLDISQYLWCSAVWGRFQWVKEQEGTSEKKKLKAPAWYNTPTAILFWVKKPIPSLP